MSITGWNTVLGRDNRHCVARYKLIPLLSGQLEGLQYPFPGSNNALHCGQSPHQNGTSFPSAGRDHDQAFIQQDLHYTAPNPSSSLMNSACDPMSLSAEGELGPKASYAAAQGDSRLGSDFTEYIQG
jgi:hypothetical protein